MMEIVLVGTQQFTIFHNRFSGWTGVRWADDKPIGPAASREDLLAEASKLPPSDHKWHPLIIDEINRTEVEDLAEYQESYDSPREAFERAKEIVQKLQETRWPQTFLARAERDDGKDFYSDYDYRMIGKLEKRYRKKVSQQ